MKKIRTEILIPAAVDQVWNVLLNTSEYPTWNPFIRNFEGEIEENKKVKISIAPPGGSGMSFSPTILKKEKNRELRWLGKLGISGLFDGEHYFILEEVSSTETRLIHGENFSGLLVPFLGLDKTEEGFKLMNEAIKKRFTSGIA
jgi:hypothetical protein